MRKNYKITQEITDILKSIFIKRLLNSILLKYYIHSSFKDLLFDINSDLLWKDIIKAKNVD